MTMRAGVGSLSRLIRHRRRDKRDSSALATPLLALTAMWECLRAFEDSFVHWRFVCAGWRRPPRKAKVGKRERAALITDRCT